MKVILKKDIVGLGKRSDIKEVREGYFRNFLAPNNLAIPATKDGIKELEKKVALKETADKIYSEKISLTLAKLSGRVFTIDAKINEKGSLYKAISAKDIAKKLADERFPEIKAEWIAADKPIKEAGKSEIEIKIPGEDAAKIFIEVREQR